MSGQRGQALVGVLVILTLILLLAGSVAVGASALLAGERQPDNAVVDDLTVQSSVAGSVARVAASPGLCPTPTATGPLVSTKGFPLSLPAAASGKQPKSVTFSCIGIAQQGTGGPILVSATALPTGCWSADLSGAGTNAWSILFDARWTAGGSAFVAAGGQSSCPRPAGQKCLVPVQPSTNAITQVAMLCSVTNLSRPALFVTGAQAVGQVVVVPGPGGEEEGSGSGNAAFFLLAAGTGLPTGRDYEEGLLALAHSSLQLQYEGPMR